MWRTRGIAYLAVGCNASHSHLVSEIQRIARRQTRHVAKDVSTAPVIPTTAAAHSAPLTLQYRGDTLTRGTVGPTSDWRRSARLEALLAQRKGDGARRHLRRDRHLRHPRRGRARRPRRHAPHALAAPVRHRRKIPRARRQLWRIGVTGAQPPARGLARRRAAAAAAAAASPRTGASGGAATRGRGRPGCGGGGNAGGGGGRAGAVETVRDRRLGGPLGRWHGRAASTAVRRRRLLGRGGG